METILNNPNPKFSVLGGGSWATALVKILTDNGNEVSWFMRDKGNIKYIKEFNHNPSYLQAVELNLENIYLSDDINEVIDRGDILIVAIPSAYFLDAFQELKVELEGKFILSATKGFVGSKYYTVAEYFNKYHRITFDCLGVIGGPCHAEEVAMEKLSYMTVAAKDQNMSAYLCKFFQNNYVNAVTGTDIYGVEHAAALKNIYAIAVGICHNLGYGDNYLAVLVTCAFHEMKFFLNHSHPDKDRLTTTSAYLGDLMVTCYSQFSRNRTFGAMIGKGYSVLSALMEMEQVTEGYYASKAIHSLNKKIGAQMPIMDAVYAILYENKNARQEVNKMNKNLK